MIGVFGNPILVFLFSIAIPAFADPSCDCAQMTCSPCEVQTGTTFYTAKCGTNGSRVKSCKRPTCEVVANQKLCLARLNGVEPKASITNTVDEISRELPNLASEAGEILDVVGDVQVAHASGVIEKPRKREPAYVGDVFETKATGRVKVLLRDGSEMSVAGDSRLKIEKVDVDSTALKRQIALRILSGRVRTKVEKEYQGDNFFQVKTHTAVAGVRGTDFITSYLPKDGQMVSEIRTLKGLVHLQASAAPAEHGVPAQLDVPAGTFASLTTPAVDDSADDHAIHAAAAKARPSPLYKLKDDEVRRLNLEDFLPLKEVSVTPVIRSVASDDLPICNAPEGRFDQCSYTCMNNPKGETKCRADLPGVACVRRLCRANGRWENSVTLPRGDAGRCAAIRPTVAPCDGYW